MQSGANPLQVPVDSYAKGEDSQLFHASLLLGVFSHP